VNECDNNGNGGPPAPAGDTRLFVRSRYRRVRPQVVRRLTAKVREICPWVRDCDQPLVRAWAQIELLADETFANLYKSGVVTPKGEPRQLVNTLRALRNTQIALAIQLGLSPRARLEITRGDHPGALDAVSRRIQDAVAADASEGHESES
jgi:hypothetical protein